MKITLLLIFLGSFAQAQTLDKASLEALSQTQTLLTSPSERAAALQKDSGAKAADDKLKAIPGMTAADQQKAYEISSQIMANLVQQTGGDVNKQKELMEQASRDPQAFFNNLPADQRKQIEDLSKKAESQQH